MAHKRIGNRADLRIVEVGSNFQRDWNVTHVLVGQTLLFLFQL